MAKLGLKIAKLRPKMDKLRKKMDMMRKKMAYNPYFKYSAASGDINVIHPRDQVAT